MIIGVRGQPADGQLELIPEDLPISLHKASLGGLAYRFPISEGVLRLPNDNF